MGDNAADYLGGAIILGYIATVWVVGMVCKLMLWLERK